MIKSNKIARIISDLFIPPTFNLIGFIYIAFYSENDFSEQLIIVVSSLILGVILPITFFVILRKKNLVTDNDAVNKRERHSPYYISIILNFLGVVFIEIFSGNTLAGVFWLVLAINTIGLTFINYFWKISAHAIGAATIVGLLFFLDSSLFPYFVVLVIVIGLSRYILRVHTPAQIIAGTLYGFFITLFQLQFAVELFNVS